MGILGEKRRFESVELSIVGGQSENCPSDAKELYSVKREIPLDEERQSSLVHVTYRSLPRKSKKKLEEVLLGWSKWHSQYFRNDTDEELESGEESYYPALCVGSDSSCTLSFLSDIPLIKKHCNGLTGIDKELVPLYDRGYAAPLCLYDSGSESKSLVIQEDTRCFNCGSYDHSLKDCSRPKDNDAIANARKQHQTKKKGNGSLQIPTRYFQALSAGRYDGLKQGSLSTETRQLLGIGDQDPPPWHNRMRELGYPQGNTVVVTEVEEQPSGIALITGDETMDAEKNDDTGSKISKLVKKNSACFPGMNIPPSRHHVPDNCSAFHPRGVDSQAKKPNYLPHSELYYRRPMPDPSWVDNELRGSRGFGMTSALDSFRAERDSRDAKLFGRFGANPPPDNLFWDDREYMDARFPRSFRGSTPRHNPFWTDMDYRDARFSRSLGVAPNYFSHSYPSHLTDSPRRDFSQGNYMIRSPDRWRSFHSVDERFSFRSPRDHLPFSFGPPDSSLIFPTQRTYDSRNPHNGY